MNRVLIVTAIELERRAIRRRLRRDPLVAHADSWEIHSVGIGAGHLPAEFASYVSLVLIAGIAGGLDPSLTVGDVVLELCCALEGLPMRSPARRAKIGSVERPICTTAEKAELFASTGAVAVEMEAATLKARFDARRIPWVHLRAISDSADDSIDPAVLSLVDVLGRPRPATVASYLVRNPLRLKTLQKLGRSSALAADRLADEVANLLPQLLTMPMPPVAVTSKADRTTP